MSAPEYRQVVSVFLASPGDLAHERELAKEIVARFNRRWARFFNLTVELLVWEDMASSYGRPQETINREQVARCELFVGMLHQRWGSATGKYTSGFHEEFSISEESLKKNGRPEIGLLFKGVDQERAKDPGRSLEKVLSFKKSVQDRVLHHTFNDDAEFEQHFDNILIDHVQRLKKSDARQLTQEAQSDRSEATAIEAPGTPEPQDQQLPPDAIVFLKAFASKAQGSSETTPVSRVEIARFRLLGTIVSSGNDEDTLGVHDANALFVRRADLDLTWKECAALFEAGIAHFTSGNVPYWHWLKRVKGFDGNFIAIRTLVGSDKRRAGALRLMRLLRLPIVGSADITRANYVSIWLEPGDDTRVREAALEYLADCGLAADLPTIKAEVERANYQTVQSATNAYLSILRRQSAEDALVALISLDAERVKGTIVDDIFSRPEALSTKTLLAAVGHRAPRVRSAAMEVLRARKAVSKDITEQLSLDDTPEVRLQALLARLEMGEAITDDTARKTLVRQRASKGISYGLGLLEVSEGDEQLGEFRRLRMQSMPSLVLNSELTNATIFDQALAIESMRRSFKKQSNELRQALDNQFKDWFSREFMTLAASSLKEETVQKIGELEETLRKEWTRIALDVITSKGDRSDLLLVRKTLNSEFIHPARGDIAYLSKFGEWVDVKTVLAFSEKPDVRNRRSFLGSFLNEEDTKFFAASLCAIAGLRLAELLAVVSSYSMRSAVVREASSAAFKALKNEHILTYLRDPSDVFRRTVALKAVAYLPRSQVQALFQAHMNFETERYYNVTTWLDLGVAISHSDAALIAKRALEDQTP